MKKTTTTAVLTCPHCGEKQGVTIPSTVCLMMYTCTACGKDTTTPSGSDACCVICEYSDTTCPKPHQNIQ